MNRRGQADTGRFLTVERLLATIGSLSLLALAFERLVIFGALHPAAGRIYTLVTHGGGVTLRCDASTGVLVPLLLAISRKNFPR